MTFGEKVRDRRVLSGMTQTELANKIGVSLRTIRGWEAENRRPKSRELYDRLAEVLDCPLGYLQTDDDAFILAATEQYGSSGMRQAQALVDELGGMFAGGALSESDKDAVMRALQEAYWQAKEENRQKYTPKKYRK